MLIVLAIAISVGAVLLVAYPIVAKPRSAQTAASSAQEELDELLARRDAVFQALRDLNFDHRVGKITDDDFAVFEANLKESAAETLKSLDKWETQASISLDTALERTIAARQAALLSGGRSCPDCGKPAATDDKFCAACGKSLLDVAARPEPPAQTVCARCGRPIQPDDRFCGACGAPLATEVRVQQASS
jgi:RNA polymerase subunit RPABC4/transcription elongation factor Spt4